MKKRREISRENKMIKMMYRGERKMSLIKGIDLTLMKEDTF